MSVATKLWTIEDLEAMEDDGKVYEILRGELTEVPGPKFQHGFLVGRLLSILWNFVDRRGLGVVINNCAFDLGRDPVSFLIPDVAFVTNERLPAEDMDWNFYLGPPDLALEVVSPSDSATEVHDKIIEFLEAGTRVVVAVWPPSQSISVHRQNGETKEFKIGDVLEFDDVLPGFRLPVADVFARGRTTSPSTDTEQE